MEINSSFAIGTLGMILILGAFIANQLHKLSEDSVVYDLINLVGSGLLVVYALIIESYPFAILNGVWFLVSLHDRINDLKKR